jgi:cephalosporin-C deacetylase-like acetyl esterase
MAAALGSKNRAKGKQWQDALQYALATYEVAGEVERGQALKAIARKVVDNAIKGDKDAIREVADRLDGKPNVSVDVTQTLEIIRTAAEMTDDELATLASAGSSRAASKAQGEDQPTRVH